MLVQSKLHKELIGHVDGEPYHVLFDVDGTAEVEEAVGEQLLQLGSVELVPDQTDITKMNAKQLKKYASENGIDIGEASTKKDILPIIQGQGGSGSATTIETQTVPTE